MEGDDEAQFLGLLQAVLRDRQLPDRIFAGAREAATTDRGKNPSNASAVSATNSAQRKSLQRDFDMAQTLPQRNSDTSREVIRLPIRF